jgi:hypothetical protein
MWVLEDFCPQYTEDTEAPDDPARVIYLFSLSGALVVSMLFVQRVLLCVVRHSQMSKSYCLCPVAEGGRSPSQEDKDMYKGCQRAK